MSRTRSAPLLTPEQLEAHRLGFEVPVNQRVASVLTGRSMKRLDYERYRGVGLKWYRDGRSIRYFLSDILAATGKGAQA